MLPYSKQHRPLHNSAVSGPGKPLNDTRNTGIPIATPTAVPPSHGSRRNEPSPQFDLNFNASLLNSKFNDKNGLHKAPSNTATGAETSSKSTQLTVLLSGGPTRRNDTSSPAQKEESSPWHDKPDQHRRDISSDYTRSMQTPATKKRGLEQTNTTNDYDNDKDNRKNGNKDMGIDRPRKRMSNKTVSTSDANLSSSSDDSTDDEHNSSTSANLSKHSDLSFSTSSSYSDMDDVQPAFSKEAKERRPTAKRSNSQHKSQKEVYDKESLQMLTWMLEKERTKVAVYSSKLRRASRRIHKISKQLETYASEIPMTMSNQSRQKTTTATTDIIMEETVKTSRRNSVNTINAPSVIAGIDENKGKEVVQQKFSYEFPLASNEKPSPLRNLHTHQWRNAFSRKPRSLLFHRLPDARGKDSIDLIVASALDGQIRCWKYGHQELEHIIRDTQLEKTWPETMSWITDHILAVGAPARDSPVPRQLSLVHFSSSSRHSLMSQVQHLHDRPHSNGINVIEPLSTNKEQFSFATAGNDKQIVVWHMTRSNNLQTPATLKSVDYLPKRHTSSIYALAHLSSFNVLYSGGADNRLLAWDLATSREVYQNKLTERINHIHRNPIDPHLLLVTVSGTQDQLLLYDHRTPHDPVLRFGFPQQSRLSRYIAPSWHCDGYMVACGQQDKPHISIWDIRYKDVRSSPCQLIQSHDKRIIEVRFHPTKSVLGSISSDLSMNFMDFTL